jgi:hypothetical protein
LASNCFAVNRFAVIFLGGVFLIEE